jgi:protein-S-isoprenylcysteine O-methyltransferase Ste14
VNRSWLRAAGTGRQCAPAALDWRFSNPPHFTVRILVGWWLLWGSPAVLIYALVVVCAVHVRMLLAEEPWAARNFGAEWEMYQARVPRWLI